MPFSQDNAWPAGLHTIFANARDRGHATFDERYNGPYDKLLNYCFGDGFKFYVAAYNPPEDDGRERLDCIVSMVVFDGVGRPVLAVEAKDESWADKGERRYRVDQQMRERFAMTLEDCPLPRLWGLSLLGTSMRVYCADTASYDLDPPAVPRPEPSARILPSSYLAGEWEVDILSEEGFTKMKEIVDDILTHAN